MLEFISDIANNIEDIDLVLDNSVFSVLYDIINFIAYFVDLKLIITFFSITVIIDIIDIVMSIILRLKSFISL